MGSAAFLNEAVNQLAQAYLERKQQEQKRRIPHDQYPQELQKVRMRLADANVFGVDLNPIATELAEVSLWLNAIYGETDERAAPSRPGCPGSATSSSPATPWWAPAPRYSGRVSSTPRGTSGDRTASRSPTPSAGSMPYHGAWPRLSRAGTTRSITSCSPTRGCATTPTRRSRSTSAASWTGSRPGRRPCSVPSPSLEIRRLQAAQRQDRRPLGRARPAVGPGPRPHRRHTAGLARHRRGPHQQPGQQGGHPQGRHAERGRRHRHPLPPPQAGDGLLVRPLVLAPRSGQAPSRAAPNGSPRSAPSWKATSWRSTSSRSWTSTSPPKVRL